MNCSMPGLPVPHQLPEFTQSLGLLIIIMALNLSYLLVGLIIPLTGPGFFSLRAFLGILAHFSMWNLESFYPGNPSEWLLIRIALDVRLMRSDIYMTFNLIIKNIVYLDNDPNTCICVVSSRRCWSFLYVPSVNIGYLHWRCTMNTADMISCPCIFAYLRSWRDSLSSTRFSYLST